MAEDPLVTMTEDFAKLTQLHETVLKLEGEVQRLFTASRGLARLMGNTLDAARTCLTTNGRASRDVVAEVARATGALQAASATLTTHDLQAELERAAEQLQRIQMQAIYLEMEDAMRAAEREE